MSMVMSFLAVEEAQGVALMQDPAGIVDFLESASGPSLYIDKAWHGIHFLLSGEAWGDDLPLGFIVGGEYIGEEDVGYGPARFLSSAQVAQIADALAPISRADLMGRWDARAVRDADIYAVNADDYDGEEEYLGGYYEAVKDFVKTAADAQQSLILWLS